jgi:flagellar biogenesis protein FliO
LKTAVRVALLAAAVALGAAFRSAEAQLPTARSAPTSQVAAGDNAIESHSIDSVSVGTPVPEIKSGTVGQNTNSFDVFRVTLSLAVVLGLILILRVAAKRILPGVSRNRSTQAIKVLSKCSVSPRQNLLLVQVGKRLILVGDGGAQLSALSEFHEGPEAEALLAQIRDETAASASKFESLFGKAEAEFASGRDIENQSGTAPTHTTGASEDPTQVDSSIGDTMGGDESNDEAAAARESFDSTSEIRDPSLQATQKEILGLSEKVRELARQLRA